jgi:hypothetical protein
LLQVDGAETGGETVDVGQTGACWNADITALVDVDGVALVVGEEEKLVMNDGAADLAAIAIVVELRVGDLAAGGTAFGVEVAVLEVLVDAAVDAVRAGKNGGVELTARGVSKLWRELIGDQGEVADGVVGKVDEFAGDSFIVVVDAFDFEVVVAGRWPPIDGPEPMPRPPEEATPGLSSDTLSTPLCPPPVMLAPPMVAEGMEESSSFPNEVVRFCVVVSSVALAAAVTSTEVVCAPTARAMFAVAVEFSTTWMPLRVEEVKPAAAALRS